MSTKMSAFLADPDQESRTTELRDFIGPRADAYLATYQKLRESSILATGGRPKLRFFPGGFSSAAFFLGPVWFFYRKMWLWAWGIVAVMVVLGLIPRTGSFGVPLGMVLALSARRIYVEHAVGRLQALRAENGGMLSLSAVQKAGGVSPLAGGISGVVLFLLLAVSIAAVVLQSRGVLPPTQ